MPVRRRSWQRGAPVSLGMGYTHLLSSSRTQHNSTRRKRHHRNHHNKDTVVASTVDNTPTVEQQAREHPETPMRKEVSVCLRSMSPSHQATTMSRTATDSQLPLRVVLPPEKMADNKSSRLLTLDKDCNKKLNDSETTDDNNKTLNVEEFECGVSVAGSDKQEWSFTLYDFDGKGKITKEDLGSLLRSLYDAVGSSINLPKSGSKTLKLRLTVSPDTSKVAGASRQTVESHSSSSRDKNNKTKESKLNKDLDNSKLSGKDLKLDNINNRTEQLNLEAIAGGAAQEAKVHHKEVKNNLSNPGKPVAAKPKLLTTVEQRHLAELVQKNMERHQQRQQQRHYQRARRDHRKHHSFNVGGANNISSTNNRSTIHTCEESRDRRNYYLDLAGIENDDPTKLLHNTSAPAELLRPGLGKRDRDHRARDGKLRARSSHNARRQQHAELQTSGAVVEAGCDVAHQRSRSYDVPAEHRCCPLTAEEELAAEVAAHRTRIVERAVEEKAEKCKTVGITGAGAGTTSTTITSSPDSPPGTSPTAAPLASPPQNASTPNKNHQHKLLRPVSLPPNVPDTVSPHHHRRHRNRDRNRKLAMQQVAEWIEREHAWNAAAAAASGGAGEKTATGSGAAAPGGTGNGAAGGVGSAAGAAEQQQRVIVQRHEHHHVHEHHHHHHYHHYHET